MFSNIPTNWEQERGFTEYQPGGGAACPPIKKKQRNLL